MRPMLRIATSGWLTIGVWSSPASLPALVTVNVEPRSSSGLRAPARAASARRSTSSASSSTEADVAAADDRHDEALVGLDGDAEVVAVEVDDLVALEPRVQLGELLQRLGAPALSTVGTRSFRSTLEKSHSSTQVTAGTSWCARAMCSAIRRRTPRSGSRRPSETGPGA